MDLAPGLGYILIPILLWIVGTAIALLLLYGVVRVAVARGLRDHQLWMERMRPQGPAYGPDTPRQF